ncbi:phosphatase PAP2 family protein [Cellulomonas hominis]
MTTPGPPARSGSAPTSPAPTSPAPASLPRRLLRALGLAAVLGIPVAVLALVVRSEASPIVSFDRSVVGAATDLVRPHPGWTRALTLWQELLQPRWVYLGGTLLCLWVWRRHGLRTRALWAVSTLMASWGLALLAKLAVQRARPVVEDAVSNAPGYSFPSGHAANTAAAGLTLTLLVWPLLSRRARVAVPLLVVAVVGATGVDRVLLGVHYPSDVAAGWLLGCALAGGSYLGFIGRASRSTTGRAADRRTTA